MNREWHEKKNTLRKSRQILSKARFDERLLRRWWFIIVRNIMTDFL